MVFAFHVPGESSGEAQAIVKQLLRIVSSTIASKYAAGKAGEHWRLQRELGDVHADVPSEGRIAAPSPWAVVLMHASLRPWRRGAERAETNYIRRTLRVNRIKNFGLAGREPPKS